MALVLIVAGLFGCSDDQPYEPQGASQQPLDVPWLQHGQDAGEARYSSLDEINQDTVEDLGIAWTYELGSSRGVETTPLVIEGVMYVTAPWSIVHAIDASNGEALWQYDPQVPKQWGRWACCDVVNRGVAVQGDLLYFAALDGRLIALDRHTGKRHWEVQTTPRDKAYTITAAPRIADGKVIIGNGGAEYGVRGYITAYDAMSGELVWRFYTVPGDPSLPLEHPDLKIALPSWNGEWWKAGGGGTAWDSMAYDADLNLIYVGTGNGSPWSRYERSPGGGDNLFLSSILALDVSSGRLRWHYQTTPADSWDYTATQHIVLTELEIEGQLRKVLMQAPKNGFMYVLDRVSGELISAEPYVDINWASHIDPVTGRPVLTSEGDYKTRLKKVAPGPQGGHNWPPMSYSERSGLLYIPAHDSEGWYKNDEDFKYDPGTWNLALNLDAEWAQSAADDPEQFRGYLIAWDPIAAAPRWRKPLAGHWNGGLLSTAGGLVFQGTADGQFSAYRDSDGELLWQAHSTTGFFAPPVTWRLNGEQYVAIAAGFGGGGMGRGVKNAIISEYQNEGRIIAFKLGGTAPMPRSEKRNLVLPELPVFATSQQQIDSGGEMFVTYCGYCHNGAGLFPDLSYSDKDVHAIFKEIVLKGAFLERGMPRFDDVLNAEQTDMIQAFVLSTAQELREELQSE